MKVGILGSGDVGQALGNGFVSRGHTVKIGAREATNEKAVAWAAKHAGKASAGTFRDTAAFGEMLVVATLWSGTENALSLAGKENFKGKVVLDVTNPLVFEPGKPPRLALGCTDSGGEQVQRWLPGARVVKVFNTVGFPHMIDPKFPGGPPTMFLAGNDPSARAAVADVCKAFGWETVDVGGIEGARLLEPLCILWVGYGASTGTWNHAFKLLRK
jgi:8-hydroxy-5-deazaflavin:NADPH oxidoreductase